MTNWADATILANETILAGAGSAWEWGTVGTLGGQGVSLAVVVRLSVCYDAN